MSDVPYSTARLQIEGLQTRAPGSESVVQAMAGAINFILDKINPVGTVIFSDLTESQFQSEIPTTAQEWILCDGRSVIGSSYQAKTGLTNVPDRRGMYLRGKNNGRSDGFQDSAGDLAIGTFADMNAGNHVHKWYSTSPGPNANSFNSVGSPVGFTPQFSGSATGIATGSGATTGIIVGDYYTAGYSSQLDETNVRRVVTNIFIRIN